MRRCLVVTDNEIAGTGKWRQGEIWRNLAKCGHGHCLNDALSRVLSELSSEGIHAREHGMRFSSEAHPTALSNPGRDALLRVP
jgi:hypothetical protein